MSSAPPPAAIAAALTGRVAGRVHWRGNARRRFARDFGRCRVATPGVVVEAQSEEDVRAALAVARDLGVPAGIRGIGGSCNGQTLCEGGIVIVNAPRHGEALRLEGECARISARQSWREVEAQLNRMGRSVPVLADFLGLTVGGTLSVGGYGADSIRHGALVDQVQGLRLIRPDGSALWCSAEEHPLLFRSSLAGLGQVGVIEEALVETVPDRPWTSLFNYTHDGLGAMVDSFAWMTKEGEAGPQLFKALSSRGRHISTCGVTTASFSQARAAHPPPTLGAPHRTLRAPRYRSWRSRTVSLWLARFAGHRRVWCDYFLEYEPFREFVGALEQMLHDGAFGAGLESIYILGIRSRPDRPRPILGVGDGLHFGIGLYSMISPRDEQTLRAVRQANDRCLEHCLALGGRPYLYGAHELDRDRMRRAYGADYDRFRALRAELDPGGSFQPGARLP